MESTRVFKFQVTLPGDVIWDGTMPIYDEYQKALIGGFTVYRGNTIWGFVAGSGYPTASRVSAGLSFWITPQTDKIGQVNSAIISECRLGFSSIEVTGAEVSNDQT